MAAMSTTQLWVLGAIAGFTIFLGLPVGRLRRPAAGLRAFLNAVAIGVLLFLFFDILAHANDIVEGALEAAKDGGGSWWRFAGFGLMLAVGLGAGLVGLVVYERLMSMRRRVRRRRRASRAAVGSLRRDRESPGQPLSTPRRLHRGGHRVAQLRRGARHWAVRAHDDISLALVLVIGFGLHNATEGFGIVAPMAADGERPSVSFLIVLGVIGGAPTFVGTIVGNSFVNDAVFLGFLALAAGSILYVVIQLVQVAARLGFRELFAWGVLIGLLAGLATDYVLVAAGL